jgi:hypothetical protein
MTRKLAGRQELVDQLIPTNFNVGCRRPTPGNGMYSKLSQKFLLADTGLGFLEALTSNKTTVYTGEIPQVTETGFVDKSGAHHEVDIIICATGLVL